jgi:hydrogenase maturation factor
LGFALEGIDEADAKELVAFLEHPAADASDEG